MKKRKKNELWYNAYSQEIGGISLNGHETALRRGRLWADARSGLWWAGLHPGSQTVIL